jgi:hypothetical protein
MASTSDFGFTELFTFIVGEIAKAVAERSGETAQQQFARSQAAVHMIMGFLPRDVVEALLAGHCVMLHETMLASVHDTLLGEADGMRHATRSGIVAMNKEFNSNLAHLERYQARPTIGKRDAPGMAPVEVLTAGTGATLSRAASARTGAEPEAARPSSKTRETPAQSTHADPAGSPDQQELDRLSENDPDCMMEYRPSPALVGECQANAEAMAALAAGDPEGFAKALGIAVPSEAFLEAANAKGSPFDPNAAGPWPAGAVPARRTA